MAEKRKDKKGRILKSGESQRSELTYQYRYVDLKGKRRYAYAKTLSELREKEKDIQRDMDDGIDYSLGEVKVVDLVSRYMNLKRGLKENSRRAYSSAYNKIADDPFGQKQIKDVKLSDAKTWLVSLHDSGMKQNTIGIVQNLLRPAFEMAVEDDMIRKNPFKFKLSDIIPNDAYVRDALTKAQQERYLEFIKEHGRDNYYDDILILLGTGLRVSELYGITISDVDFERRCIHIERQLCRTADKPYFIETPKTKAGIRTIPMSDIVYSAFWRVIHRRKTKGVEKMIDGHIGFVFLDKSGMPKVGMHLENYMRNMYRKYVKLYGHTLPSVTPHVLRHTFCTNMQRAGIDVKSLQYLMGHSNVSVTLDIYTHSDYESVEAAFEKALAIM